MKFQKEVDENLKKMQERNTSNKVCQLQREMNDIKNAANNKNYVKRIFNIDQLIPIEIISTDPRYR